MKRCLMPQLTNEEYSELMTELVKTRGRLAIALTVIEESVSFIKQIHPDTLEELGAGGLVDNLLIKMRNMRNI